MSAEPLKVGDRVDYGIHKNGTVRRVGVGTVWADFETSFGAYPLNGPITQFRRHVEALPSIKIGDFVFFRNEQTRRIACVNQPTGEAADFEEAKLESWIRKFWNREF